MFISAEEKKKRNLFLGKKKNFKRGLKARATWHSRGEGQRHQEHKAIPSRTLARNSPWKSFPFITEHSKKMKTNKKQGWFYQASTKVELLLEASFSSPHHVLRNSAATEKMISPVYTTHNSPVGFDVSKGSFNPHEWKQVFERDNSPALSPRQGGAAGSQQVCDRTDFTPPSPETSAMDFPQVLIGDKLSAAFPSLCALLTSGALPTAWAVPFSQAWEGFAFSERAKKIWLKREPSLFAPKAKLHLMVIGLSSHLNPRLFGACSGLPSHSPCFWLSPNYLCVLQTLGRESQWQPWR